MNQYAGFNAMKPSFLQNATRCVFVGDLSFFCTELDLAECFKHCGSISRLEVKRGRHGDSLLYGFVEFHQEASAELAIREMHGVKLLGRRMKVNWTDTKPTPTPGADQWVQVHVNFLSLDIGLKISEEFLESVFIQFGTIGDIIVKRHSCSSAPPVVSGYAFIYFHDAYAAFRAIHGCKGINVEGVHFECALSRQYENQLAQANGTATRGFKKHPQAPAGGNSFHHDRHVNSHQGHMPHQQGTYHSGYHQHQYMSQQFPPQAPTYNNHHVRRTQANNHIDNHVGQQHYNRGVGGGVYRDQGLYGASIGFGGDNGTRPVGGRSPSMVATNFPEYSRNSYDFGPANSDPLVRGGVSIDDKLARDEFLASMSFFSKPSNEESFKLPSNQSKMTDFEDGSSSGSSMLSDFWASHSTQVNDFGTSSQIPIPPSFTTVSFETNEATSL